MNNLQELYREVIIDHSKRPRNFGILEPHDHSARGHNPLCGDTLKIFVRFEKETIIAVSFVGEGCAISKASASLMTEVVSGKTAAQFAQLFKDFKSITMTQHELPPQAGKLAVFAGVRDFPARVKCATLAWHALAAALNDEKCVQTE